MAYKSGRDIDGYDFILLAIRVLKQSNIEIELMKTLDYILLAIRVLKQIALLNVRSGI